MGASRAQEALPQGMLLSTDTERAHVTCDLTFFDSSSASFVFPTVRRHAAATVSVAVAATLTAGGKQYTNGSKYTPPNATRQPSRKRSVAASTSTIAAGIPRVVKCRVLESTLPTCAVTRKYKLAFYRCICLWVCVLLPAMNVLSSSAEDAKSRDALAPWGIDWGRVGHSGCTV